MPLAYSPGWDAVEPFGLGLLFVGVVIFVAIGALSHEQERAWSATIIYLAVGIAGAFALDLLGVGALDPTTKTGSLVIERITEVALVVAVFGAGLAVEDAIGWRKWRNVAMLLLVAMPLTIGAVALFGVWAMGLSTGAAIMLGAILAPTDPVLAGDVGLGAPGENTQSSEPRFSLHTEAGMNDGLAAPFIVLGIFVLERGGTGWLGEWILVDVLYALLAAAAVGAICGYGIAAGTVRLRNRHFLDHAFDQYVGLAAGLVAYGASESIGSYGFLAVFVAGFAFRRYEFGHEVNGRVHEGTEGYGKLLELTVILLLGSLLTLDRLEIPGLAGWLLAPLLLLVIRPLSVVPLADRRTMKLKERMFLGWFGVRGVAGLFYASLVVHEKVLPPDEAELVFWTAAIVVMVSIVVHGLTATPLTRRWLEPES